MHSNALKWHHSRNQILPSLITNHLSVCEQVQYRIYIHITLMCTHTHTHTHTQRADRNTKKETVPSQLSAQQASHQPQPQSPSMSASTWLQTRSQTGSRYTHRDTRNNLHTSSKRCTFPESSKEEVAKSTCSFQSIYSIMFSIQEQCIHHSRSHTFSLSTCACTCMSLCVCVCVCVLCMNPAASRPIQSDERGKQLQKCCLQN